MNVTDLSWMSGYILKSNKVKYLLLYLIAVPLPKRHLVTNYFVSYQRSILHKTSNNLFHDTPNGIRKLSPGKQTVLPCTDCKMKNSSKRVNEF